MDKYRIDSQKLQFHPKRVAQWLEGKDEWNTAKSIYPLYVEVSPVGACNHRCSFCAVDFIGYKNVQLDPGLFALRLCEMGAAGVKSIMWAGEGEPLLHKRINDFVVVAGAAGIDSAFTTNGVLLNKLDLANVSWVKVSMNAGSRETYAKVHQTKERDWDTVWANLRDAVKRKGNCTIGVQMVVLPENESETANLQAMCNDVGVDYLVLKPYSQHKFSITHKYEGYKPINIVGGKKTIVRENAIKTTSHPYDKCNSTPYFWAYVMASGDVYSCSAYLLDERFNLGNLNTQTFREVWEGEKRRSNWELMKTLDINGCRVNCRMARSNEYLAGFETTEHLAFI